MECSQCGLCCLSGPCFEIPIGDEKYKRIDGKLVHDCPYLTNDNGKYICSNKNIIHNNTCTNSSKTRSKEIINE